MSNNDTFHWFRQKQHQNQPRQVLTPDLLCDAFCLLFFAHDLNIYRNAHMCDLEWPRMVIIKDFFVSKPCVGPNGFQIINRIVFYVCRRSCRNGGPKVIYIFGPFEDKSTDCVGRYHVRTLGKSQAFPSNS